LIGTRKDIDMAQHDMIIDNAPGLTFRTDLNAALAAAVTLNAGAIEPPTKYPGMLWLDLSVTPNGGLRMRNQTNTGWVSLVFAAEPVVGATAATVLTSGNVSYAGTDPANVTFPIGTSLLVKNTANVARSLSISPRISTGSTGWYDLVGATALAGSWRARGTWGAGTDWIILAERVS